MRVHAHMLSCVWLFPTPWTIAHHGILCPCNFPGKNTRVGCHFLLQEILPTQGLNPGLLHCRQMLYHLSLQGTLCIPMQSIDWDFPGGPVVKTPRFHCRGHRLDPWLGNWDPTCCTAAIIIIKCSRSPLYEKRHLEERWQEYKMMEQ